jgi:hypothetical protein
VIECVRRAQLSSIDLLSGTLSLVSSCLAGILGISIGKEKWIQSTRL